MPLSECHYCHKKIPNLFHKHHEQVTCLEMRRRKGLLLWRDLPKVPKPFEVPVPKGQTRLMQFHKPSETPSNFLGK